MTKRADAKPPARLQNLARGKLAGHVCPKISRRSAPGFHHKQGKKAQNFPALRAGTLQIYAPEDPPPDFPTHIKYVSTALFCSLARRPRRRDGKCSNSQLKKSLY